MPADTTHTEPKPQPQPFTITATRYGSLAVIADSRMDPAAGLVLVSEITKAPGADGKHLLPGIAPRGPQVFVVNADAPASVRAVEDLRAANEAERAAQVAGPVASVHMARENAKLKAENAELRQAIAAIAGENDEIRADVRAAEAAYDRMSSTALRSMPWPFHAYEMRDFLPHAGRYIAECVANHAAMRLRKKGDRVELPARIEVDADGRMHAWATVQFMHTGETPRSVDLLEAARDLGYNAVIESLRGVVSKETPEPPDPLDGIFSKNHSATAGPNDTQALRRAGERPLLDADDGPNAGWATYADDLP